MSVTRPSPRAAPWTGGSIALFADCLLAGVMAALAALPVVTAYPAFVAACAVLRERAADDRGVGPRRYWARLRQVARCGPAGFLAPTLVVGVLALDGLAILAGVPGRALLTVVLASASAAAAVLGLRVAAAWRPDRSWREAGRVAVTRARSDIGGNLLLLAAAVACALIATLVPIMALFLLGPLAMAAVALDARR